MSIGSWIDVTCGMLPIAVMICAEYAYLCTCPCMYISVFIYVHVECVFSLALEALRWLGPKQLS